MATGHVAQSQVVDECRVARALQMPADVRQLVQEAEPEVVDTIVAKRQRNNGLAVGSGCGTAGSSERGADDAFK